MHHGSVLGPLYCCPAKAHVFPDIGSIVSSKSLAHDINLLPKSEQTVSAM